MSGIDAASAVVPQRPFELCGALPEGVTVLEASAGTGKTFTIAALSARFVAGGLPLERLLLVTFTRMATGELRERVRERLLVTERELSRVLAGADPVADDEVVRLLASGEPDEVRVRRDRLAAALAGFDAATIDTTHSFCQSVLDELGTLGELEPGTTFAEDLEDLLCEVVDDLYVRRFHRFEGRPQIGPDDALAIARTAIEHPLADLYPVSPAEDSVPAMRRRLALAARDELERRKRALAVMTYDDLLTRLQRTLAGPRGAAAAARLRDRYRVVLIDEFQDTDPVQWDIVRRAFADGDTTLVLIADPKQAIYAFRGADVYAYLDAVATAGTRRTLTINRRSDQRLLDGFDALFGDARLGHPGIVYRRVQAARCNREPRLHGAPGAALRIRVVDRREPGIELTRGGNAQSDSVRAHIARDLSVEAVGLLESSAQIELRHDDGTSSGRESVAPRHLAVLVQTHRNAALVQAELESAGVPAVIAGAGSVFATPAASDWLRVLEALERPASPPRARAAALTPLLGWTAAQLAGADDAQLEALHRQLYGWAHVLRGRGMAALLDAVLIGRRVPGRLLGARDGERRLTDLQHVGQLLHVAASGEGLGVAALGAWLRQRIAAAWREGANDDLTRRLESDAEAVQVLTVHRAKGLEFPIVYVPFLWEPGLIPRGSEPVFFHDAERGNRRAVDVGLEGGEYRDHLTQYKREKRGEDLRLAYVALTRARHQAVMWWAAGWNSGDSPLSRLLLAQDEDGNVAWSCRTPASDATVFDRFGDVAARAPDAVSVEWARRRPPRTWIERSSENQRLSASRFQRRLDRLWRRTSYSAITAAAHEALVASEPEQRGVIDEPAGALPVAAGMPPSAGIVARQLPLAAMAMGPRVGTIVHRALEATDFTAPSLEPALAQALASAGTPGSVAEELGCRIEIVAEGLGQALATPLEGALGRLSLRDVPRRDRLDELSFELPLAGGDEPSGAVSPASIGQLLADRLPPGDPLASYAERLRDPALGAAFRGFLTGSIDLVLRVVGPAGRPRYAIVDYKTNWLAAAGEELTAWHYRPAALAAEMERSHYALQALLYAVALHRYLRWRAPGYEPSTDLAGIHYLFLRGMLGSDGDQLEGGGVFAWRPPAELVTGLSDLLDRGAAAMRAPKGVAR